MVFVGCCVVVRDKNKFGEGWEAALDAPQTGHFLASANSLSIQVNFNSQEGGRDQFTLIYGYLGTNQPIHLFGRILD